MFDFGDNPIEKKYVFKNKYFIVCHAEGGGGEHYYKWMYGGKQGSGPYRDGCGFISLNGTSW